MDGRAIPAEERVNLRFLAIHAFAVVLFAGTLAVLKSVHERAFYDYLACILYLPVFYAANSYRHRLTYIGGGAVSLIVFVSFIYSSVDIPDGPVSTVLVFSGFVFLAAELLFQRKRAERALRISEETARALLDASIESAILLDLNGCVLAINEAAATRLGQDAEALVGQCVFDLLPSDVAKARKERFDKLLATGRPMRLEDQRDGKLFKHIAFPIFDTQGKMTRVATYARDVTEQKRQEEELLNLATTDSLTGLSNRRHFMEALDRTLSQAQRYRRPLSFIMIDVDRFKGVNDLHGHNVGDTVLCAFVDTCRGLVRDVDCLGRIGGEEFGVFLPETGLNDAHAIAERFRQEVERSTIRAGEEKIAITISAGVSTLTEDVKDMDVLLKHADTALYEAKRAGRNRVEVFQPSHSKRLSG